MGKKIKILLGKPGLDGHDRGVKVVARALRNAGMEVVYTGLQQTPEMIVEASMQEDVDAIGLSILSGAHMTIFKKIKKLMKENGIEDKLLFGGGIISENDIKELNKLGVGKIFTPGVPTEEIINYLENTVGVN